MPIADSKKAQTIINLLYEQVTNPVAHANSVAGAIKDAITSEGLQDQFTTAELNALNSFATDLAALASSSVIPAIAARYVPTHDANAGRLLTITGVND